LIRGRIRVRLFFAIWLVVSIAASISIASGSYVVGIVAALVGAFAIVTLASNMLEASVRPVADAARRMHEGDLDVRARVSRDDDVGQLGAVFDELATSFSRTMGELRSERDLVSRILDGMQEGVLLLDKDGKVALMNPALREMLLLRADVLGQPLLEVVRHAELKELLDRVRVTKNPCSGEVELGGLKPRRLLVRGTAFDKAGGGLLAVFFDVTDIRRLETTGAGGGSPQALERAAAALRARADWLDAQSRTMRAKARAK